MRLRWFIDNIVKAKQRTLKDMQMLTSCNGILLITKIWNYSNNKTILFWFYPFKCIEYIRTYFKCTSIACTISKDSEQYNYEVYVLLCIILFEILISEYTLLLLLNSFLSCALIPLT